MGLRIRERRFEARRKLEPAIIAGRVPPHDLDAEAAVLSAILLARDALDLVLELLKPEHFYSDANGRIYDAAIELARTGKPVDSVAVASYLRDRDRLAQVGGAPYLAQLADATPAVAHVAAHAQVVCEKWRLRALIATCQRVAAEGYGDVGEPQTFIDAAEQAVFELAHGGSESTTSASISDALVTVFRQIRDAAERGDTIAGLSTGYERLDRALSGLHEGELVIVAGRPGMGKSALVQNIAVNVASPRHRIVDEQEIEVPGRAVHVFTLEMPKEQIARRMVCAEARVAVEKVKAGNLEPEEWRKITNAGVYLKTLPIQIDDTPALGLLELRAKVRRHQAEHSRAGTRVGLVVVDYLQLMRMRNDAGTRDEAIGEVTRGLKQLAKELHVPVLLLSQLNRAVESRADKRPQLSDLRESGNIEQDADAVLFVYRDEYYNPESKAKGVAEVIIAKQRDGATGRVHLRFAGPCMRFDNLAYGDYPELEAEAWS
jgi:replicative DNA helicase